MWVCNRCSYQQRKPGECGVCRTDLHCESCGKEPAECGCPPEE